MGSLRKPTIVLVHGAFQWPDCFDRLIPYLEDAGYAVNNHIRLPSTGNASTSSLQQDADTVREAVLHILDGDQQRQEEGSDCVMVMHSYGAIPTAQALRGLSREERGLNNTAVVKMVYLSCNMPRVGESHRQQLEDLSTRMGLRRTHDHVAINDGVITFVGTPEMIYNDLSEEEQAHWYANLKTQSAATFMTPQTYAAYKDIPGWYLITTRDNLMPIAFQKACADVVGDKLEVVEEIDAGHASFLVKPDVVADFILGAVRSLDG